jgi:lysophospholipase L1-like esterase
MTKRSMRRAAGHVAIAIALLGCGGDSFDGVRNLRSTNEVIVCLGDSLTEGVGANGGEDYPAVLSRELAFPVLNQGRRGDII